MQYQNITRQLFTANDKNIFAKTGCLSLCDKYAYTTRQVGGMIYESGNITKTSTLTLQMYYTDVEHELREQVTLPRLSTIYNFITFIISVCYLWYRCIHSWCWRLSGFAPWPKHLWPLWNNYTLVGVQNDELRHHAVWNKISRLIHVAATV